MNGHYPVFREIHPEKEQRPLVLSSPHSGTAIPRELQAAFRENISGAIDDTDWYIDELYNFATELGGSQVCANLSRYVIDLNRDPSGQALYDDKRQETGLVPLRSFAGEPLYRPGCEPTATEVRRRIAEYYDPYYQRISELLQERVKTFGKVIFFDCHSIKRHVPSIRSEPFPDLIIGTQDGRTANEKLCTLAIDSLNRHGIYAVSYNNPFKGGHLTRWFGRPSSNVHGIQLEMSQDLYLHPGTRTIDQRKWTSLKEVLRTLLNDLLVGLESVNAVL